MSPQIPYILGNTYILNFNAPLQGFDSNMSFMISSNGIVSLHIHFGIMDIPIGVDVILPFCILSIGTLQENIISQHFIERMSLPGSNFLNVIEGWQNKTIIELLIAFEEHFN